MSRVDEALRKAAEPSGSAVRGLHRAGDSTPLAVDEWTLDHYPRESVSTVPVVHLPVPARAQEAPASPRVALHPRVAAAAEHADARPVSKLVGLETGSVAAEQYRRLAATLHEAQIARGIKTILVTSAAPQEGKTFTVANLAATLAESYGRNVLAIDADLHRPSLHEQFHIPNGAGLSEMLTTDRQDVPFVRVSPLLNVLPGGTPGPTPLAGLVSDRMRALLQECASQFDWVLLDAPPVGLLSDAQLLAGLTDAVVFVIAAGTTPFDIVERAVDDLGRDSIIGTVLNRVDERAIPVAGYYDRYVQTGD